MALKIIKILTIMFALVSCNLAAKDTHKYSAEEYFKNYALSTCIADGFESKEVVSEAAAAARGYLELGEYPLEAHTEATLLGRQFLKREYKSKSGAKLTIMKCIDFYHSHELDELAKKYQNKS